METKKIKFLSDTRAKSFIKTEKFFYGIEKNHHNKLMINFTCFLKNSGQSLKQDVRVGFHIDPFLWRFHIEPYLEKPADQAHHQGRGLLPGISWRKQNYRFCYESESGG
jgi:hypothetical protein